MKKSTEKISSALQSLWLRRQELLRILTADQQVLIGTVCDTLRRCGNPNCHCAEKPSHLQTLLHFKKAGRYVCRFVRKEDADSLRQAAQLYRDWRNFMREFQTLQTRERTLLKMQIQKRAMRLK